MGSNELVVINRPPVSPETPLRHWNLVARQIGEQALVLPADAVYKGYVIVPGQIGFSLPPKKIDVHPRSLEVGILSIAGLGRQEIAERLFLTKDTVKMYLHGLYAELNAENAAEAATKLLVLRLGSVDDIPNVALTRDVTNRQLSVATGIAQGMTNEAIGACLDLSRHTVDKHLMGIMDATGIRERRALVLGLFWAGIFKPQ